MASLRDTDKKDEAVRLSKRRKLRIIYDPPTNSILVANASTSQLQEIEQLIKEYDQPASADSTKMRRNGVIKVRYSRASTIATAIKDVYRDLLSSRDKEFDSKDKKQQGSNRESITVIRYGAGPDSGDGPKKTAADQDRFRRGAVDRRRRRRQHAHRLGPGGNLRQRGRDDPPAGRGSPAANDRASVPASTGGSIRRVCRRPSLKRSPILGPAAARKSRPLRRPPKRRRNQRKVKGRARAARNPAINVAGWHALRLGEGRGAGQVTESCHARRGLRACHPIR